MLQLAERWHLHPADVDPRTQRPARAAWFFWALDMLRLADRLERRAPAP